METFIWIALAVLLLAAIDFNKKEAEKLQAWKDSLPTLEEEKLWEEYESVSDLLRRQDAEIDTRDRYDALEQEFKRRGISADFSL